MQANRRLRDCALVRRFYQIDTFGRSEPDHWTQTCRSADISPVTTSILFAVHIAVQRLLSRFCAVLKAVWLTVAGRSDRRSRGFEFLEIQKEI